jgi:HAD superfamily hydrolase (TIGR01484 family)
VRPLAALDAETASALRGVVFDLDDTVLDDGELGLDAYEGLFRMRQAGLRLIACTGRPSGWAEVVARTWPVEACVAENGACVWHKRAPGTVVLVDPVDPADRRARRASLAALADAVIAQHPTMGLSDDTAARRTDIAFDVREHRRVADDVVAAARARLVAAGARTFLSTIHLHASFDAADKATGSIAFLVEALGEGATTARSRWAFVGDSDNDAPAFAAFRTTFGVANVRARLGALTIPPAFVAEAPRGAGFAEIARRLAALRAPCAKGAGE